MLILLSVGPSLACYCQHSPESYSIMQFIDISSGTRNAVIVPLTHRDIATNTGRVSTSDWGTCVHCYVQYSSLPVHGNDTEGMTGPFMQTE